MMTPPTYVTPSRTSIENPFADTPDEGEEDGGSVSGAGAVAGAGSASDSGYVTGAVSGICSVAGAVSEGAAAAMNKFNGAGK